MVFKVSSKSIHSVIFYDDELWYWEAVVQDTQDSAVLCSTVQIKLLLNLDKVDWKTNIWSESGAVLLHLCPQCRAGWENQRVLYSHKNTRLMGCLLSETGRILAQTVAFLCGFALYLITN